MEEIEFVTYISCTVMYSIQLYLTHVVKLVQVITVIVHVIEFL